MVREFFIVNDIQQPLSRKHPQWEHWATVKRPRPNGTHDEYIVYHYPPRGLTYIERVVRDLATFKLEQITDDNEFQDIHDYCMAAGILYRTTKREMKIGFWEDDQLQKFELNS